MNEHIPKCTNEDLVRLHFAYSNLNYKKIDRKLKLNPPEVFNMFLRHSFNILGKNTEIPPQDVIDGIIDSIHYAVSFRLANLDNKNSSGNEVDIFLFLKANIIYSHMYYLFESYWQGILWGSYTLETNKGKLVIKQIESEENIAHLVSLNRKMKLEMGDNLFDFSNVLKDNKILGCKKNKVVCKTVKSLDEIESVTYYSLFHKSEKLKIEFPDKLINDKISNQDFSISNVLDVFINLVMFSRDVYESLEIENTEYNKNFINLCPFFKISEISRKLSLVTGLRYNVITQIIDFLTFKYYKDNLWSEPICILRKNNLTILLSSIVTPNLGRLLDYWLKKAFKDISSKGITYEDNLVDYINLSLENNRKFSDYDKAISETFRINGEEEEIDCIFRFGKIVVVCEAKCIITVDSETSKFNALKAVKKASRQANRKAEFVRNNLEDIFKDSKWIFDSAINYEVLPVISNSNRIFVGTKFSNVPVVDEIILSAFFKSNKKPLLSVDSNEHLAWFEVYDNFEEAQSNFELYLEKPPQIALDSRYIEPISSFPFDGPLNIGVDIEVISLTLKKYELIDVIEAEYPFPIVKSKDYADKINRLNILI